LIQGKFPFLQRRGSIARVPQGVPVVLNSSVKPIEPASGIKKNIGSAAAVFAMTYSFRRSSGNASMQ
jgi:hypothetical protein